MRVLVIGGGSGIGFAAAQSFTEIADEVYVLGRRREALEEAAKALPGGRAVLADAGDAAALGAALDGLGPLDHAVVTAGGGAGAGTLADLDDAEMRRAFEEKFWVHWTALRVLRPLVAPEGSLTFVTAVRTRMAEPQSVGLAAVNGAIEAMIPSLAKELAPVRVNAVAPGVIATPPWMAMEETARRETFAAFGARTLAGRVGAPKEVGAAIRAVATNGYITGEILKVDGGFSL